MIIKIPSSNIFSWAAIRFPANAANSLRKSMFCLGGWYTRARVTGFSLLAVFEIMAPKTAIQDSRKISTRKSVFENRHYTRRDSSEVPVQQASIIKFYLPGVMRWFFHFQYHRWITFRMCCSTQWMEIIDIHSTTVDMRIHPKTMHWRGNGDNHKRPLDLRLRKCLPAPNPCTSWSTHEDNSCCVPFSHVDPVFSHTAKLPHLPCLLWRFLRRFLQGRSIGHLHRCAGRWIENGEGVDKVL